MKKALLFVLLAAALLLSFVAGCGHGACPLH